MSHEPFKDLVITFEGGFRPLLDKEGKVLFAKDGQLAANEITKVMELIKSHL